MKISGLFYLGNICKFLFGSHLFFNPKPWKAHDQLWGLEERRPKKYALNIKQSTSDFGLPASAKTNCNLQRIDVFSTLL